MDAWSVLFQGSRSEIIGDLQSSTEVPQTAKDAIVNILSLFAEDSPITVRKERRPTDPSKEIGIDNFVDVTITQTGRYRVSSSGHPDFNVPVLIQVEPDFSSSKKEES